MSWKFCHTEILEETIPREIHVWMVFVFAHSVYVYLFRCTNLHLNLSTYMCKFWFSYQEDFCAWIHIICNQISHYTRTICRCVRGTWYNWHIIFKGIVVFLLLRYNKEESRRWELTNHVFKENGQLLPYCNLRHWLNIK